MKKFISVILSTIIIFSVFILPTNVYGATTTSQAGVVTLSSGRLNVRKSTSTGSTILTSLSNGSYITLVSKSGDWYYVEYADGMYGYCHKDYIKLDSGKTAKVSTQSTSLNVRSGAGTGYTIKDILPKGEVVIILSESDGWSKILYNGVKTGYVSSKYLSVNSNNSYSDITLSVPSFKQTDSRWANVIIGNSGKTIGKIGCATTAIAMLESYRTGTTIYPNAMAKKLSYTSGGAVYWPSHYTIITSSSGYLGKIYNLLKEGKPVLIGEKKSNGSQHYVVITGVKATSSLTTSSFYINDPGSNTRTTLNQFFAEYPNFYKMMSY
jgi:uncharacterized protein YgiM (DUF1202 family)